MQPQTLTEVRGLQLAFLIYEMAADTWWAPQSERIYRQLIDCSKLSDKPNEFCRQLMGRTLNLLKSD